ncbi:kunitz-type serine protease inhibitor IX-like [Hyaena hyaena]|uniref:kunitz-type serine protease inhibitor IX-like n=1 Tax=Hyaena hyaena TaxID=95912 RepID=UPI001922C731|nr:kunitz-type serine protease inhibitor IX-like [Hyaena hyaena]
MKFSLLLALGLVGIDSLGKTSVYFSQESSQELAETRPALCQLHRVSGPCQASFNRYFYNPRTSRCEPFVYGGCQGNANNFQSEETCQRVCKALWEGSNVTFTGDDRVDRDDEGEGGSDQGGK